MGGATGGTGETVPGIGELPVWSLLFNPSGNVACNAGRLFFVFRRWRTIFSLCDHASLSVMNKNSRRQKCIIFFGPRSIQFTCSMLLYL